MYNKLINRNLKKFFKYLIPYKWNEIIILALTILSIFIAYAPPFLIGWFIDDIIYNKKANLIFLYFVIVLAIQITSQLLNSFQAVLYTTTTQRIVFNIRIEIFKHLQKLKLNYFHNNETGEILTKITNDVETVSNGLSHILIVILTSFLNVAISFFYLFYTDKHLTVIALLILPIYIGIQRKYKKKLKDATGKLREAYGIFSSSIFENISGMVEVRATCNEKFEQLNFLKRLKNLYKYNIGVTLTKVQSDFIINFFSFFGSTFILALGGYQIILGHLTIGKLIAFNTILGRLNSSIIQLVNSNLNFQSVVVSIERIYSLLEEEVEEDGEITITENSNISDIEFRNVSFSYDEELKVFENLSFKIYKGETVAIIGENGCGKSSIVDLLLKNYCPQQGHIFIGGLDLKKIKKKSFLQHIGVIRQDNFLFNVSIYDNILYGNRKATKEKIEASAKDACIHDFIIGLPEKYNTMVGERGVKLSGGQRQKICLARAIVSDPQILIMDEATSYVDSQSEKEIYHALKNIFKGRTSIIMTHNVSNMINVDKILALGKNGIKEYSYSEYIYDFYNIGLGLGRSFNQHFKCRY